jgi:hypothetical protein
MKAINSKRQIRSMTPFRELMSFGTPSVDIKSDYDFTKNWSKYHSLEGKKERDHTSKALSSIELLKAQQDEITKLQNKVKKLQYEKLVLVKWLHFLY